MTEAPDRPSPSPDNLPEPPFDELYQLYLRTMAHDRKRWMAALATDCRLEERMAMAAQPSTPDEFRRYLDQCDRDGTRSWVVNCLVLGPEYRHAHPDDPRVRPPAARLHAMRTAVERAWAEVVTRRGPGPRGGPGLS